VIISGAYTLQLLLVALLKAKYLNTTVSFMGPFNEIEKPSTYTLQVLVGDL